MEYYDNWGEIFEQLAMDSIGKGINVVFIGLNYENLIYIALKIVENDCYE